MSTPREKQREKKRESEMAPIPMYYTPTSKQLMSDTRSEGERGSRTRQNERAPSERARARERERERARECDRALSERARGRERVSERGGQGGSEAIREGSACGKQQHACLFWKKRPEMSDVFVQKRDVKETEGTGLRTHGRESRERGPASGERGREAEREGEGDRERGGAGKEGEAREPEYRLARVGGGGLGGCKSCNLKYCCNSCPVKGSSKKKTHNGTMKHNSKMKQRRSTSVYTL